MQFAEPGTASVTIYSVSGQKVKTFTQRTINRGRLSLRWNGRADTGQALPSGEYLVRVQFNACHSGQPIVRVKKIILLK